MPLRRLRLDQGMTIAELAEASGVSGQQIRALENGKTRNPQVSTLSALALVLGVRPSEIDPLSTGEVS